MNYPNGTGASLIVVFGKRLGVWISLSVCVAVCCKNVRIIKQLKKEVLKKIKYVWLRRKIVRK